MEGFYEIKRSGNGGLALTILGTFCPLITMPIMRSSNFYTGWGIKSIDGNQYCYL